MMTPRIATALTLTGGLLISLLTFLALEMFERSQTPLQAVIAQRTESLAAVIGGAAGVLLTLVVSFIVYQRANCMRNSERLVEQRTRELSESEARIRAVLENTVEGIITINSRGIVESFNPAAEKIFGYSRMEVIGRNVRMLMPEPHSSRHDDYIENYLTTHVAKIIGSGREVEGLRADGTTFPMGLSVGEWRLDDGRAFTGIVRDISERKKVDQLKNEFVSTVSHELRTPLTSIRGSLGLVLGGAAGEIPEKMRSMLEIANNNCERLVRLVNDMLDIERIEMGKMRYDIRLCEVHDLVREAVERNRSYALDREVELEFIGTESALPVLVDGDRFAQVMDNLLSNAAKFSPRGGSILIRVERVAAQCRVSVIDQGPGIEPEHFDRVFAKFSQVDPSDARAKGGSGLGLSICKALIESLGGRIEFDSVPGEGSTFYFELPVFEGAREGHRTIRNGAGGAGHDILICEDDHDVARLLSVMLEQAGFGTRIAHSAAQARDLLRHESFSAMTLDLNLPDQDGISFLREMRREMLAEGLPIIVVSASAEDGVSRISGAIEVLDWIAKPIDQARLIRSVQAAVGRRHDGKASVLHVEDDPDIVAVVENLLRDRCTVTSCADLATAGQVIAEGHFDLIILDIQLRDGPGLDLLPIIEKSDPPPPVLVFSAYEVDSTLIERVDSSLLKASTTNEQLLATITRLINRGLEPDPESPFRQKGKSQ